MSYVICFPGNSTFDQVLKLDNLRPGFLKALGLLLRVREDGLAMFGPPCGPWVWVNRATGGRSAALPSGDTTLKYIRDSNKFRGFLMFWEV